MSSCRGILLQREGRWVLTKGAVIGRRPHGAVKMSTVVWGSGQDAYRAANRAVYGGRVVQQRQMATPHILRAWCWCRCRCYCCRPSSHAASPSPPLRARRKRFGGPWPSTAHAGLLHAAAQSTPTPTPALAPAPTISCPRPPHALRLTVRCTAASKTTARSSSSHTAGPLAGLSPGGSAGLAF